MSTFLYDTREFFDKSCSRVLLWTIGPELLTDSVCVHTVAAEARAVSFAPFARGKLQLAFDYSRFGLLTLGQLVDGLETSFDLVPQRIQVERRREPVIHAAALAPAEERTWSADDRASIFLSCNVLEVCTTICREIRKKNNFNINCLLMLTHAATVCRVTSILRTWSKRTWGFRWISSAWHPGTFAWTYGATNNPKQQAVRTHASTCQRK